MMIKMNTCLLCPNPVPSYLVDQGWTLCKECYSKYATHIKNYVPISIKPTYKPVILDREYFERSPVFTENLEPVMYFIVPEQVGFAVDEWIKLAPMTSQMRYMGKVLNSTPEVPQESELDKLKNNKRKIDV